MTANMSFMLRAWYSIYSSIFQSPFVFVFFKVTSKLPENFTEFGFTACYKIQNPLTKVLATTFFKIYFFIFNRNNERVIEVYADV